MFKYSYNNKRYHTLDYFYKNKFKDKVFKVSLNANFSCPNIDGTVGTGGCIYCSKTGSGEFAGNKEDDILKQFNTVKEMMHKKWPKAKYIGYFQARTNTYAPVEKLKQLYEEILKQKNVVGLNIATRPDSITDECLEYLKDLNKLDMQGIKIHMLSVIKNTPLEKLYYKEKFHILTKEEYIDIVVDQLELLRPEIVINRITGDPKIDDLIEPKWLTKKFCVLNDIDKEMVKRDTYQGKKIVH